MLIIHHTHYIIVLSIKRIHILYSIYSTNTIHTYNTFMINTINKSMIIFLQSLVYLLIYYLLRQRHI